MKIAQNVFPDAAGIVSKVVSRKFLTDKCFILTIERKNLGFYAGQHFSLGPPDGGINREYSVYSGTTEKNISFLIKIIEEGCVSKILASDHIKEVRLHGPYSNFIIPEEWLASKFLFVATGTGVAPFASFIRSFSELNYKLLFGTRLKSEQYEAHIFGDRCIPCISGAIGSDKKRVTDELRSLQLDSYDYIYMCGNANMIVDVQNILDERQYSGSVKSEVFF